MEPRQLNSQLKIWKESDQQTSRNLPSAPIDSSKHPINFSLQYTIEIEGKLTRSEERTWMLKIAVNIVGALTQGLDLSPDAIMQIGMELEKFIAPRLIHLAATSFGTGPRVRVSGEYKAFTCFGAA
ncbi:hypothetical protein JYU34_005366, partial [Plutella xylostella]